MSAVERGVRDTHNILLKCSVTSGNVVILYLSLFAWRRVVFQYSDGKALGSPEAKAALYLLTKYCVKNGVANVQCRPS